MKNDRAFLSALVLENQGINGNSQKTGSWIAYLRFSSTTQETKKGFAEGGEKR